MKTKSVAKRISVIVSVIATSAVITFTAGCGTPAEPGETKTVKDFPNSTTTQVGQYLYEVRFTDTDGIKWKCFAMQAGYAGGLDGCEKVG